MLLGLSQSSERQRWSPAYSGPPLGKAKCRNALHVLWRQQLMDSLPKSMEVCGMEVWGTEVWYGGMVWRYGVWRYGGMDMGYGGM